MAATYHNRLFHPRLVRERVAAVPPAFEAFDGVADLFVYFFERGIQVLKPGGRLGFIVSNKWLRGGYAENLRTLFAKKTTREPLKKRRPKSQRWSSAELKHLRELYENEVEPMQERQSEILKLERLFAAEVHKAYGLTPADEQLLWDTAPPRMPVIAVGAQLRLSILQERQGRRQHHQRVRLVRPTSLRVQQPVVDFLMRRMNAALRGGKQA